jgi:hypothetical protein
MNSFGKTMVLVIGMTGLMLTAPAFLIGFGLSGATGALVCTGIVLGISLLISLIWIARI